ncbi:MAG: hydroxymethylbilane synthase [Chloroflexi bacterium]|nr:hydroxymethylbilane synthase [Chloroflexota bacterium]
MNKGDVASTITTGTHTLTLGTRASKLALMQAEIVRAALLVLRPEIEINFKEITTRGDAVQDRPLSQIGGNGLFVTQIEAALRAGEIALAVHSAKDLSSTLPPDMALAAFLPRADPRDVLVSQEGATLSDLPSGARIGTSSPRRACQLTALRPDLQLLDIRGNVDTRLRKLRGGEYDAILLAAAGLERLGLLDAITEWLDPDIMLPAVAQGVLAVEVRAGDTYMVELISSLSDPQTTVAVCAERAFLASVGGGCSLPVGAYATLNGESLRLRGMLGAPDGRIVRGELTGPLAEAETLGAALAGELLTNGGQELIDAAEAEIG